MRGAARARRQHHRDRRPAAARDEASAFPLRVFLEDLQEPVGIARRDTVRNAAVEPFRRRGIEVVGEVGARDQEDASAFALRLRSAFA